MCAKASWSTWRWRRWWSLWRTWSRTQRTWDQVSLLMRLQQDHVVNFLTWQYVRDLLSVLTDLRVLLLEWAFCFCYVGFCLLFRKYSSKFLLNLAKDTFFSFSESLWSKSCLHLFNGYKIMTPSVFTLVSYKLLNVQFDLTRGTKSPRNIILFINYSFII